MGISTDAYLFYGIEFDPEADDANFDVSLFHDLMEKYHFTDHDHVVVDYHCHEECPIYFVTIRWSFYRASRGYPEAFSPTALCELDREWMDKTLRHFCERNGLEFKEPKWILASCWR